MKITEITKHFLHFVCHKKLLLEFCKLLLDAEEKYIFHYAMKRGDITKYLEM